MADTHGEKLKELELQTLKTQWPIFKAEALIDSLANKLTEVDGQTSLVTLVKVKAEALVFRKRRGGCQQTDSHNNLSQE